MASKTVVTGLLQESVFLPTRNSLLLSSSLASCIKYPDCFLFKKSASKLQRASLDSASQGKPYLVDFQNENGPRDRTCTASSVVFAVKFSNIKYIYIINNYNFQSKPCLILKRIHFGIESGFDRENRYGLV